MRYEGIWKMAEDDDAYQSATFWMEELTVEFLRLGLDMRAVPAKFNSHDRIVLSVGATTGVAEETITIDVASDLCMVLQTFEPGQIEYYEVLDYARKATEDEEEGLESRFIVDEFLGRLDE